MKSKTCRALLLAAVFVAAKAVFPMPASAQVSVECVNCHDEVTDTLRWVQQAKEMVQQYQTLVDQYEALAHLPQQVMSMAQQLDTTPSLENPLPQVNAISGIMNGTGLGPVSGLANQFENTNRYYQPEGEDWTAQEMNRQAQATGGVQAIATQALQAIQQRASDLNDFVDGIGDSPDVQQSAALQARLQLEQNFVAGQQVQAQQLAVLQQAEEQVDQQREQEKVRQDYDILYDETAPTGDDLNAGE